MAFDIEELVKKAIKEMKDDRSWKGYEERINYKSDYKRKTTSVPVGRAIVLLILRGEGFETIPVRFEVSEKSTSETCLGEIKKQLKLYFKGTRNYGGADSAQYFSVEDLLKKRPDIDHWFKGSSK